MALSCVVGGSVIHRIYPTGFTPDRSTYGGILPKTPLLGLRKPAGPTKKRIESDHLCCYY